MHVIQIIRSYLGVSQQELARRVGITQADLCEMEIKPPYGRLDKYQRLSNYLGVPIHAQLSTMQIYTQIINDQQDTALIQMSEEIMGEFDET